MFRHVRTQCTQACTKCSWKHRGMHVLTSESEVSTCIPLFIAAVLYILFIIAPFTLLLFLWQWLQAKSDSRLLSWVKSPNLKPLMDSYTAPYRDKQHYWVGMLLLICSGLFLTFVAITTLGDPSIALPFLAWNQGGIYKKWYLSVLESFFILQLGFLSAATYDV